MLVFYENHVLCFTHPINQLDMKLMLSNFSSPRVFERGAATPGSNEKQEFTGSMEHGLVTNQSSRIISVVLLCVIKCC